MTDPARAARLTAIAVQSEHGHYNSDYYDGTDDVRFLLAHVASLQREQERLQADNARLASETTVHYGYRRTAEAQRDAALAALRSIANSSCCGCCQEAALVAKAALLQRCDGRYEVPQKRDEPFPVTYRCSLPVGHVGPCGLDAALKATELPAPAQETER